MFRSIIHTLLSSILFLGCDSVKTATINGSLENISDKSISISIGSDARTLLKTQEDAFSCEIKEDGSFSYSIDFDAPIWITMVSDEYHFIGHILLISEGENEIYADCNRLRETIEYSGANGTLNTFYREWDEKYNEVLRELKSQGLDHSDWVSSLDSIELVGMESLHELQNETTLSINELRWLSSNIKYRKFSSWANRAYRAGSKPGDQEFDFFDKLNLNDEEACMVSKTYNGVIHDYVLYHVNLQGAFWDPAGDNTEFHELMYNTALQELSGKVRDVELNILVSDLLNSNNLEAPVYFEKFLKDCKTKDLHKMANQLYNDYVLLSNRELGPNVEIISTDNKAPLEVLTQFENKVLYLDFWAGWCSPCINSMPKTFVYRQAFNPQ